MRTLTRTRLGLAIALMAALAGCSGPCDKIDSINGPKLNSNGVDLSTYVAVGTSLSSGYESGGLVDRHQVHSFPSVFARQIGKSVEIMGGSGTFTQPTINQDGIPALLEIKSFSPLVIDNTGRTTGAPTNQGQSFAYHNLGIPGAILVDLVDTTNYHNTVPPVNRQNFTYFNLIQRGRGTVLAQALSLQPTIMSIEYGANEVLGPATSGVAPDPATGPAYAQLMTIALNTIHTSAPDTRVAVFNVPDVTTIPFFTTLPAFTQSLTTGQLVPLVGVNGDCAPGDLILLPASATIATGTGIPAGGYNYLNPSAGSNGQPLPEALILRAAEVSATEAVITQLNAVVDSVSARPFVAKVDLAALLATAASTGFRIGGADYTNEFVTGGLFGLDGVHPNDLGYALMANAMIDAVNSRFGCLVPTVNVLSYASTNASALAPAGERYPLVRGLDEHLRMLFGRR